MNKPNTQPAALTWQQSLSLYQHPKTIALFFLGFSAGLPFLLVFSTLNLWLRELEISRTTIGFFSFIGITYSIKIFWAPVVDQVNLYRLSSYLGKRRSWMLLAQIGIAVGLIIMAVTDPLHSLTTIALAALLVAFSSATQDIAIDAYRIEIATEELQGALAASYQFGYRVALLVAGAGALYIADYSQSWRISYFSMAALMTVGVVTVFLIKEPRHLQNHSARVTEEELNLFIEKFDRAKRWPQWFKVSYIWFSKAVIAPFVEFFKRNGIKLSIIILIFIGCYRISDIAMGAMAYPLYVDLGFSKSQIASIVKLFGLAMTLIGAALGGLLVARWGVYRTLLLGAVMVSVTNLFFAVLAQFEANTFYLALVISGDNLSTGLSGTAFLAYLANLTNTTYTATQYALFSSLMTLPGKTISGFSGVIVDSQGYGFFFSYAALLGVPAILLVLYLKKIHSTQNHPS